MRERTLIPPVPREYATYTEQEKNKKTEHYYDELYEVENRIDGRLQEYEQRINAVLEKQNGLNELLDILNEEDARLLCRYRYEFALLDRMAEIAKTEQAFNESGIWEQGSCLPMLVEWYQKCIFLIRRFEFDWEEDRELSDLVEQKKISCICLSELICVKDIIQKIQTGCRIAMYLHQNGCQREAVLLLMMLERKLPYSERKVMHFAMTLLDMGERQLAYEVLMKHQNPDEDIKELQSALKKML